MTWNRKGRWRIYRVGDDGDCDSDDDNGVFQQAEWEGLMAQCHCETSLPSASLQGHQHASCDDDRDGDDVSSLKYTNTMIMMMVAKISGVHFIEFVDFENNECVHSGVGVFSAGAKNIFRRRKAKDGE